MAEEIWRPGLLIGNPDGLQFALTLSFADKLGLAWGEGMVFLAGESVWFAEGPEGQEIPLSWTWADLLAFLGRWWPWLVLEEDYPLPLQPLYPAFFHTRIRPWFEVRNALEEVGETIAAAVLTSSNPRARQALELWKQREKNLTEKELYLTTGLSSDARNRLPVIDWRSAEIRAVARMSSGAYSLRCLSGKVVRWKPLLHGVNATVRSLSSTMRRVPGLDMSMVSEPPWHMSLPISSLIAKGPCRRVKYWADGTAGVSWKRGWRQQSPMGRSNRLMLGIWESGWIRRWK